MPSRSSGAESSNTRVAENVRVQSRGTVLLLVAVALPAIIAFGLLYRQSLAVPYQDDYRVILDFATDYHQLPVLSGLDHSNPNLNSPMIDPVTRKAFPGEDELRRAH